MQKAKPERQLETDERFSDAELTKLTQGVLDEHIGERAYDAKEAPNWLQKIVQEVLSRILERQPRFKVLVHGVLLQRVGAGLHSKRIQLFLSSHNRFHHYSLPTLLIFQWQDFLVSCVKYLKLPVHSKTEENIHAR